MLLVAFVKVIPGLLPEGQTAHGFEYDDAGSPVFFHEL